MSVTTFYTSAGSAAELAEALLLTSSPASPSVSLSSASSDTSSVDDLMMLDFEPDDSPLPSPSCLLAYGESGIDSPDSSHQLWPASRRQAPRSSSFDLLLSDSAAMSSAVFCFIKNFVCAAGGSSTVAIDNKIEQAMDLVKSHLMFAVREEVEVLKERIAELEERIAFLESENAILRSTATQDALAQIAHLETTFNPTAVSMADGGNTIVATASAAAGPVVMPGSSINISVASTATNTVPNASSTQPANGAPPAAP